MYILGKFEPIIALRSHGHAHTFNSEVSFPNIIFFLNFPKCCLNNLKIERKQKLGPELNFFFFVFSNVYRRTNKWRVSKCHATVRNWDPVYTEITDLNAQKFAGRPLLLFRTTVAQMLCLHGILVFLIATYHESA